MSSLPLAALWDAPDPAALARLLPELADRLRKTDTVLASVSAPAASRRSGRVTATVPPPTAHVSSHTSPVNSALWEMMTTPPLKARRPRARASR